MKKKLYLIFTIVFAAVLLTSLIMLVRQQLQYRESAASYEEAARNAGFMPPSAGFAASPALEPDQEPSGTDSPVPEELKGLDLAALRAVNSDVAGWIYIPGTQLSYPILKGTNNSYYLNHTWDRKYNSGGAIFLEQHSSSDFSDFHTIIYGHRMNNDSMFGTLKYYSQPDFWRDHPSVYIAAGGSVYCYDVFAAWEAGVTGLVYRLDLESSHLEEGFLRTCIEGSVLDTGIVPEATDRILTLSTCTNRGYAKRWVVQAVLRNVWTVE